MCEDFEIPIGRQNFCIPTNTPCGCIPKDRRGHTLLHSNFDTYRIRSTFGSDFNLAVWRI